MKGPPATEHGEEGGPNDSVYRGLGVNLPLPPTSYSVESYFISYTSDSSSVK